MINVEAVQAIESLSFFIIGITVTLTVIGAIGLVRSVRQLKSHH